MSRICPAFILAGALACTVACDGGKPPASKSDGAVPEANEPTPAPARAPVSAEPVVERDTQFTPESPSETDDRPPPPSWFDADKIAHAAVISHSASEGKIAGGYASAMVLELEPGTTTPQCVERVQALLGESLTDLAEPSVGADGRQTIQGKAPGYHYTIVCGEAKGKPTLYLSYTSQ